MSKKALFLSAVIIILIIAAVFFYFYQNLNNGRDYSISEEANIVIDNFDANNLDEALKVAEDAVKKYKNDSNAFVALASVYVQKGSLEFKELEYGQKALEAAQKALEIDSNNSEAYRVSGYAYEIMQKYNEAFVAYSKAIELNSQNALAYANRGHAYSLIGDLDKAEADYQKALSIDSSLSSAYINLARVYIAHTKYDEARNMLAMVENISANIVQKASAKQILGTLEVALGNHEKGKEYLIEAISYDPNLASAWVEIGRANYFLSSQTQDYEFLALIQEALINVNQATKINPNQTTAYVLLATILDTLGQRGDAINALNTALEKVDMDITLGKDEKEITKSEINNQLATLK